MLPRAPPPAVSPWLSPVTDGPLDEAHWSQEYPACAGKRQSPINLQARKIRYVRLRKGLLLTGYQAQDCKFNMTNVGHTGKG